MNLTLNDVEKASRRRELEILAKELLPADIWVRTGRESCRLILCYHIKMCKQVGSHIATNEEIAKYCGYCIRTVQNAHNALKKYGLLQIEMRKYNTKMNLPNLFTLLAEARFLVRRIIDHHRGESMSESMGAERFTPNNTDTYISSSTSTTTCSDVYDSKKIEVTDVMDTWSENCISTESDTNTPPLARQGVEEEAAPDTSLETASFSRMVRLWPQFQENPAPNSPTEMVDALEALRAEKLPGYNVEMWQWQKQKYGQTAYEALFLTVFLTHRREIDAGETRERIRNPASYLSGILRKPRHEINPGETLRRYDEHANPADPLKTNSSPFNFESLSTTARPIVKALDGMLPNDKLRSWFRSPTFSREGQDVILHDRPFALDWIKNNFLQQLEHAVRIAYGPGTRLVFGGEHV